MIKNLIKISDCESNDLLNIINLGIEFKNSKKSTILSNKTAILLFDKPSLRTKLSFIAGVQKLGGNAIYFSPEEVGMGSREPIPDVSSVVSRMGDLAIIRTFEQEKIEIFSNYSKIPVINALTDDEHPCQALADIMTIHENLGTLIDKKITYIGDCNNVAKSLGYAVLSLGGLFSVSSPKGYEFDNETSDTMGPFKFRIRKSKFTFPNTDITKPVFEIEGKGILIPNDAKYKKKHLGYSISIFDITDKNPCPVFTNIS